MNDLQDKIVDLHGGAHGTKTRTFPAKCGVPADGTVTWERAAGSVLLTNASGIGSWSVPMTVEVGERLLAVRARVRDNATGATTITMRVRRGDDSAGTQLGTDTSAGTGVAQTIEVDGLEDECAAEDCYFVDFEQSADANEVALYQIEWDVDRPA